MMNVTGVWKEGVTGKGVISALVDDGLDYESRDLAPNFVSGQSYQLVKSADNGLVSSRFIRFQRPRAASKTKTVG
jgi:subtilisin family serine protease